VLSTISPQMNPLVFRTLQKDNKWSTLRWNECFKDEVTGKRLLMNDSDL
jgi:hypothetical protein